MAFAYAYEVILHLENVQPLIQFLLNLLSYPQYYIVVVLSCQAKEMLFFPPNDFKFIIRRTHDGGKEQAKTKHFPSLLLSPPAAVIVIISDIMTITLWKNLPK